MSRSCHLTGDGLAGAAYIVEDDAADQPVVFSSEPGRDDDNPCLDAAPRRLSGPLRAGSSP